MTEIDLHSGKPGSCVACCGFDSRARLGLLIVLILAAATRLIALGSLDVWGDEVYSHDASSDLFPKLLRWETASNESSSPWPFIEMKIARQVFGESSPLSLRMPSAVHGIFGVGLLYIVLGCVAGWRIAFWSSLMLTINPHGLEWSREGRMYTQWLGALILAIGVVHSAVEDVRLRQGAWHSWRWWLTGCLLMVVHAMNVMGTMTIAGIALWLAIVALVEMKGNRIIGLRILLGSALAGAVYLGSWGLTGIAKILLLMGGSNSAGRDTRPLTDHILEYLTALPGHVPLPVALILWLAAIAGLLLLARSGHWRIALLIAIASLTPWMGFPFISKSHFWTTRYVFTGILPLSVGLGSLLAALWQGQLLRAKVAGPVVAVVLLAGSVAFAAPYLKEIFTQPKMEVYKALAPIKEHGREGEVIMLFPDWYISFDYYKPYRFAQKVTIIRGPKGTWRDASPDTFKDTFDNLYGKSDAANVAKQPPAAWLFLLTPGHMGSDVSVWESRFKEVEPVLAAYGLKSADLASLIDAETYTITLRVSRDEQGNGKIEHVAKTRSRYYR